MSDLFDASLFEDAGKADSLELISIASTPSIDPDTKARKVTDVVTVEWEGTGSLQAAPAPRSLRITRQAAGGVEEVLVPYRAFLPATASPEAGWYVRDSTGRVYPQLTEPVNPGGYWLLNLAAPTPAAA